MFENNIYHWDAEMKVKYEMEEFRKEMEAIRLLKDASLSNPGWIERLSLAIAKKMVLLGQRLDQNYTDPHQAYQTTSSKYAA